MAAETPEELLAEWEAIPVRSQIGDEMLGILRRVLAEHSEGRYPTWCAGCGDQRHLDDCPVRAAFLVDRAGRVPAAEKAPILGGVGDRQLVVVEWEDSTNIQEWTPIAELAQWAADGGWRVRNVGWLVHEDDDCVVLAGRLAEHARPPQAGLYERIPKRAIISMRSTAREVLQAAAEGVRWRGRQAEQGHEGGQAAQGEPEQQAPGCGHGRRGCGCAEGGEEPPETLTERPAG